MPQQNSAVSNANAAPAKREALSQADINLLLKDPSAEGKIAVLGKITHLYNEQDSERSLDGNESAIVEDIFRVLMQTAEAKVRIAFSESVKNSDNLPKDIALSLAKDIDEVALPMLEFSQILSDADLKEIVQNAKNDTHLKAIARRDTVSEELSQALVEKDSSVVETLLANTGAQIGEKTYTDILDRNDPPSESIVNAMLDKGAIPVTVMEKLLKSVKGAIRQQLDEKYHVVFESKALKKEMEQNLQQATRRMMGARANEAQRNKLIKELLDTGRMSVYSGLTTGNYTLFESDMARIARVSLNNVRILLSDPGENGIKALYRASKLPPALYDATVVLIQTLQMLEAEHPNRNSRHDNFQPPEIIQRMYTVVGERKIDNLDVVISLIENGRKRLY